MVPACGYDPLFLPVAVPLPRPAAGVAGATGRLLELPYVHFTVLLHPDRRLAAATAVNIDGSLLQDVERTGTRWRLDDRVPEAVQAGEELYARNDLDRGHLVRRRDPVWGAPEVAARANADTFHYTNAAPQVAAFNQSKDLWLGLEDYILGHAESVMSRLTVLTGPVLAEGDPDYRGISVPRSFWKVAAWVGPRGLAASGYLLDQSDLLTGLLARERAGAPRPASTELGAYRTFQVPVTEIVAATGLDLGPLPAADRLVAAAAVRPQHVPLELTTMEQIVL